MEGKQTASALDIIKSHEKLGMRNRQMIGAGERTGVNSSLGHSILTGPTIKVQSSL